MKTEIASIVRTAALVAGLALAPVFAFARDDAAASRSRQVLALHGSVLIRAAGPYVEVGTFEVQVAAKLGRPAAKLADGTWLYPGYRVLQDGAAGTLVVRFENHRVSGLTLVTPAVALALSSPQKAGDKILIADNR